jgi:sugar phosphate isomerase/epimerase
MKFIVTSYSFIKYTNAGTMSQLECIAKAKELGFDGIEFSEFVLAEGETDMEHATALRKEAERVGLPIVNYAFGADFINGCNGDTKAEIARVKHMIDVAEELGVKQVRHDCTAGVKEGKFRSFDALLPQLADAVREVTEYAAAKGIRTMVENHGVFCQDSDRVEKLVNAVNHENFGLLVDIGNFTCADEDPRTAVGRVAPYAFHAHAKDFHIRKREMQDPGRGYFQSRAGTWLRGAIVGHGDVPVKACLAALKKTGYDAALTVEFEGLEDPVLGVTIGLENLRRYWEEV